VIGEMPSQPTRFREQPIGKIAVFLVPSLKLKRRSQSGQPLEERIHRFLLRRFGGYTAAAGNIFGYWKDERGRQLYGEHKEYKVGLLNDGKIPHLKRFLAELAADLSEECLYLEAGKEASFIYAASPARSRAK
jgi:hypothetical protein